MLRGYDLYDSCITCVAKPQEMNDTVECIPGRVIRAVSREPSQRGLQAKHQRSDSDLRHPPKVYEHAIFGSSKRPLVVVRIELTAVPRTDTGWQRQCASINLLRS